MFLLLAAVVVVVFLCLTVPPVDERGATALEGDLVDDPTEVELGAAGYNVVQFKLQITRK